MGPLNRAGGWRRLNVAITRARRRVEIVTSVLPADFVGDLKNDGIRHLRRYIDFAVRGVQALALDLSESAGDAESPFEEEVLRTIRSWGYDAIPQVGCASYRIDIGIRHPDQPGRFLLAVECDGAMYHSSKVARDRDRLRQRVLEGLGWRFHRIWGISWYRDRAGEEQRLRDAIDAAFISDDQPPATASAPSTTPIEVATETVDFSAPPAWVSPYQAPKLPWANSCYDMHAPDARPRLRQLVRLAIEQEAPVHDERVLRAAREAWNVGRAGARIRDAFNSVIGEFIRLELVTRDRAGFIRLTRADGGPVRVPTDDPDSVRPISQMPPEELEAAIIRITADAGSIGRDDLRVRVARLFGWGRVGGDIGDAIDSAIARTNRDGRMTEEGAYLRAVPLA
jgi:very-short-patch-repair endonuclease